MKRIASLDFLRGISMLGLIFYHAFDLSVYPSFQNDLYSFPPYIFVPLCIIFIFSAWRGFFLLISGAAHIFSMQKSIENGQNLILLLLKQLLMAILLFMHGIWIQIFWNPYIFPKVELSYLQWSDAVEIIAICMFITSIIYFLLTLGKGKTKHFRNAVIFCCLMILTFTFTSYIREWVTASTGLIPSSIQSFPATSPKERMQMLGLALLVGYQEPLFPYFGVYCLGCILGILLSQPHLPKKKTLFFGYGTGFGFVVGGLLVWIFKEHGALPELFMIPPMWLFIIFTGMQIIFIFLFLHYFEFSPKILHRVKYTRIIRRAGMLCLTIFTFQCFDIIPRWILTQLTNYDFVTRFQVSLGLAILCGGASVIFWILVLNVWGLLRNYFTIEWFFLLAKNLIQWKKIDWKDPLSQEKIIKNIDPVSFVP